MRLARTIAAVAPLLALPGPAWAQTPDRGARHAGSAASSYEVRREAGALVLTARNVRFEPYALFLGERHAPRVLTVTTAQTQRTDREGSEGRVAVTVDDLSGAAPRRLASFSDPGNEGVRLGERHFVTTQFGCCASPIVRRVRLLENGRLLFNATGPGPTGVSAWLEAPNARPPLRRWAAFDGMFDEAASRRGVVGVLAYGSEAGTIQRFELRYRSDEPHSMDMSLSHGGRMMWVQPEHDAEGGSPESPVAIWGLDGGRPTAGIGGFSMRLLDGEGKVAVEVPVAADRFVPERATLGAGFSLEASPARP